MSNKKDFLIEEDESLIEPKPKEIKTKEQILKEERKRLKKNIIITVSFMTILTTIIFVFGLIWQRRYDLWAISNSFWLTFAVLFFIAWIFFVYNKNILSPMIHGFKVFGLMLVGKRTKESYYDYMMKIEENPIPKYIYITIFSFAFIILIPAVITMIVLL